MKDYETTPTSCLGCGVALDGALEMQSSAGPMPGDAAICLYCNTIGIYTDVMGLRYPTDDELKGILAQSNAQLAIAALNEMRRKK